MMNKLPAANPENQKLIQKHQLERWADRPKQMHWLAAVTPRARAPMHEKPQN